MSFVQVNNLCKSFGKTDVLKGITFSQEEGTVLSIIGSSGSGKTTLLRCITGLEIADKGEISIGQHITFSDTRKEKLSNDEKRENQLMTGLVFQSFNLFPQYTVLDNVMLAKKISINKSKMPKCDKSNALKELKNVAVKVIESVGLADKLNNFPWTAVK